MRLILSVPGKGRDNDSLEVENVSSHTPSEFNNDPSQTIIEDEYNSFKDPSCWLYSGPCSETNCTLIFNRAFMSDVKKHLKWDHQKQFEPTALCHICNTHIPISMLKGKQHIRIGRHMVLHDGDLHQNVRETSKMNSGFLQTEFGLKLQRDVPAGKYKY